MPSSGVQTCADRKSTRLNSSHRTISYAVFCLKKKTVAAVNADMEAYATTDTDPADNSQADCGRAEGEATSSGCTKSAQLPPAKIFFFNDTATTEIYTLSLHDALPI